MRLATVLFDLDGTLIDHFKAIHRCHAYTMKQLGLAEPSMDQVRAAVGGGVELAVERLVGPTLKAAALAIYRPYWDATMLADVELLAGARELLSLLRQRGISTAVYTNKHGPSSRLTCAHLGLTELLDGNFGATDTPWLKPDLAFTRHVLTALGANAEDTLLVGDSPFDVATSSNAGLGFIGVTTGTHTAGELQAAGADRVCTDLFAVARELSRAGL
jgi:phosphoglycolate phosphatase